MDHETEHIIRVIRASAQNSTPGKLIDLQRDSLRDETTPDRVHVTRVAFPLSNDTNLIELVVDAVRSLRDGDETFTVPVVASVAAEIIDHDDNKEDDFEGRSIEPQPTILYFHGGQFW